MLKCLVKIDFDLSPLDEKELGEGYNLDPVNRGISRLSDGSSSEDSDSSSSDGGSSDSDDSRDDSSDNSDSPQGGGGSNSSSGANRLISVAGKLKKRPPPPASLHLDIKIKRNHKITQSSSSLLRNDVS